MTRILSILSPSTLESDRIDRSATAAVSSNSALGHNRNVIDAPTNINTDRPFPSPAAPTSMSIGASTSTSAQGSQIPIVTIDTATITDTMAARLSASFLGHVLFLKSQVPFPVAQLARIPRGNPSKSRSAKKCIELLASFDTLASHLHTTFTALSTARARAHSTTTHARADEKAVYLAIVLGPSVGTAKSRTMIGIEGLETKVWGERDDVVGPRGQRDVASVDKGSGGEREGDSGCESESESSADTVSAGGSEEEEDGEGEGFNSDGPPESDSESESEDESNSENESDGEDDRKSTHSEGENSLPSSTSHAQEQAALLSAERLLSWTLANNDGGGMAAEIAPTQTHVLLRAPRRFSHPAWIPRQNLVVSMDAFLRDFLDESGRGHGHPPQKKKARGRAGKTEGVWIRNKESVNPPAMPSLEVHETCRMEDSAGKGEEDGIVGGAETEEVAEEDELIWWSWDGKLVGFADW